MPIRWRLTIFNALAIGAILLILGLSLFLLLREALLSGTESTARSRALAAAQTVGAGESLGHDEVERLTLDGVFVIIRDQHGRVLGQTVNLAAPDQRRDTVWQKALETGRPAGGTVSLSTSAPDYIYAVPVNPSNSPARVVEAGKSYESAQETIETFTAVLIAGILAAFLLSVVGAYILARAALSPVDAVVSSARQITEGDLSKRLPVTNSKDEIGRLTTTINQLLARLEAAFARREEALIRQRRFAADASHELRTPLTSIGGYAQMLQEWGLRQPETAREGVTAIQRESERMRQLVESLLTLARGDEGAPLELKPHDLSTVAAEAVHTARAAAAGKVSIEYSPPAETVVTTFDRAYIGQAVAILLDNAVKYTPKGGVVTVTLFQRDGWAGLKVSDTGVGIPEEKLPFIFQRFYRADAARTAGGAGLGLAIARQITEVHNGEIEVESTPGKGSTFTLLIPKSE